MVPTRVFLDGIIRFVIEISADTGGAREVSTAPFRDSGPRRAFCGSFEQCFVYGRRSMWRLRGEREKLCIASPCLFCFQSVVIVLYFKVFLIGERLLLCF